MSDHYRDGERALYLADTVTDPAESMRLSSLATAHFVASLRDAMTVNDWDGNDDG